MKRILFVLALVLILSLSFVGEAFALVRPWTDTGPNGDDHPWGGDEYISDPPPLDSKISSYDSFTTGILPVDILFKYFVLREISIFKSSQDQNLEFRKRTILIKDEGIRK